ncbi:MAG: (2Fe-2S)-binding protein [Deltaproteobacteria bacterium]|nr:(2Fe-2S)-binding protein [Candidatus Tharpella sp.]
MEKFVCYCFEYSEADIRKDVFDHNGRSTIIERIQAETRAGNCQCQVKNPKGS